MASTLEESQVRRAYKLYSPVYDLLFEWIFRPGREAALRELEISPGDRVLEVGVGTGLNLPMYPPHCRVTGIDISAEMMRKAQERIAEQGLEHVELRVMDAAAMDLVDDTFDGAVATYTISAVPDPIAVLGEMKRVVKPGGRLVILNHFRSERPVAGRVEDMLAPMCNHLGWSANLELAPLLERAGLHPDSVESTNLFNGWRLVRCTNRK